MPNWKLVIVSGSNASLNSLFVSNGITGSLLGTSSFAVSASYSLSSLTASFAVSGGSPTFPFTGSAIISGSLITTGSLNVSGSRFLVGKDTITGSIQFAMTQDPDSLGTDSVSTYLFNSSSNTTLGNDLYIRQDGNIVKWKWIESQLNSGILYGGIITYSGSFLYISSGSGVIVNHNATTASEISPSINYVSWGNVTQSINNITSSQITWVYVDYTGSIKQQNSFFTAEQYNTSIPLGRVVHGNYLNVTAAGSNVNTAYDSNTQQFEFIRAFGPLKVSGLNISAQSSSLSLNVQSGQSFMLGGFYSTDPENPSMYSSNTYNTASISRVYRSGSGFYTDNNAGAFYTTIDPTKYDNGSGILQNVGSANWTIQRVFFSPTTGILNIYYGQSTYTTLLNALQYISSDTFQESTETQNTTIFLGYLVVKGNTTDLTNTVQNSIIQSGVFRNSIGGSSGAGSVAISLTNLSDVSINSPTNGQALIYNSGLWVNGIPTTAHTASYVLNAVSSSFSSTASFINRLNQNVIITGSVLASSFTGSLLGTSSFAVTASYSISSLTSSFSSTASFINRLNQNVIITGSVLASSFTGSLLGTSSFSVSSSRAVSASRADSALSSSWSPNQIVGGATDFVTKWGSSTTLTTSIIRDSGSLVAINAAPTASARLYVNGNFLVNGNITTVLSKNNSFNGITMHTNGAARNTGIGNNNGGVFPLDSVGTGTDNIGIGNGSLFSLTSASFCVSIGNNAGRGITTGAGFGYNISIGQDSMRFSDVGFSIGIGTNTLFSNSSGNQNIIAIGHQAGQNGVGSNSVIIGYQAGLSATGSNNLLAGYQAGSNLTTAAKCTYLGAFTGTGFATDNNQVFISDGDGNVRIRITSSGNTLINTTTDAGYRLDVNGTTRLNGNTEINGTVKTSQPSATGAGAWKLGKKIDAAVALDTTKYIEVEIDGVVYKLGLVT